MEQYGRLGLLRSLAVTLELQQSGLGTLLTEAILHDAARHDISETLLLTTTARDFFEKKVGFAVAVREDYDERFAQSQEDWGADETGRSAEYSAGLPVWHLSPFGLLAATVMMAVILDEPVICLQIALTKSYTIVIADQTAVSDDRIEFAMREGVRLPLGQSGIEALPLFESLPASVNAAVAVVIEPSRNLGRSARYISGTSGNQKRSNKSE
jgi:hypothetical protein